jgi:hypothetical protein
MYSILIYIHILSTSTESLARKSIQISLAPSHGFSMWCRTLGQRAGEEAIWCAGGWVWHGVTCLRFQFIFLFFVDVCWFPNIGPVTWIKWVAVSPLQANSYSGHIGSAYFKSTNCEHSNSSIHAFVSHVLNLLGVRTLVQPWLIHRFSIRVLVGHSAKLERLRIRSFQQANTHTYVTYVTYVILVWHLHDLHVYPATLASVNLQKRGLCLKISVLSVLVVAWLSLVKQDVFRSWWILDQALIWSGSPLVLAQMQPCKMQWTAERLEQKQPQQPKQHVECYHINRI